MGTVRKCEACLEIVAIAWPINHLTMFILWNSNCKKHYLSHIILNVIYSTIHISYLLCSDGLLKFRITCYLGGTGVSERVDPNIA